MVRPGQIKDSKSFEMGSIWNKLFLNRVGQKKKDKSTTQRRCNPYGKLSNTGQYANHKIRKLLKINTVDN